jgi:hypothetical protein
VYVAGRQLFERDSSLYDDVDVGMWRVFLSFFLCNLCFSSLYDDVDVGMWMQLRRLRHRRERRERGRERACVRAVCVVCVLTLVASSCRMCSLYMMRCLGKMCTCE